MADGAPSISASRVSLPCSDDDVIFPLAVIKFGSKIAFHYDNFITFQHCVFLHHPLPTLLALGQDEYVDSYINKHSYLHSTRVFCITFIKY